MVCFQVGEQSGFVFRTVIKDGVLLFQQVADLADQHVRRERFELLVVEGRALDSFSAEEGETLQGCEIRFLVQFVVCTFFQQVGLVVGENLFVALCIGYQVFEDIHDLSHVFAQSLEGYRTAVLTGRQVVVAGDVVEFGCDLRSCLGLGAEVVDISEGIVERRIVQHAGIEEVGQREKVVDVIFLIEDFEAGIGFENLHIAVEIHEYGFDRSYRRILNFGQECTLGVAVHLDRGEGRFGDLLHAGVLSLAFVDNAVILGAEFFIGPGHQLFLGDGADAVELGHFVAPGNVVVEGRKVHFDTSHVRLFLAHGRYFQVVYDRLDQLFAEFAVAEFRYLCEQQIPDLVEGLTRFRKTLQHEGSVVGPLIRVREGVEYFLLLHQVEVDHAGLSVVEDPAGQQQVFRIVRCGVVRAPCQRYVRGVGTVNLLDDGFGDRGFGFEGELRDILVRLHIAEIFVDRGDHLVGIEVARKQDGHVIGHVILRVIVLYVGNRRVFQVFLRAEYGLFAVGVVRIEHFADRGVNLTVVVRQGHVFLLVDRFELGVESADHDVLEAVGLDPGPVLDLVRRNVFDIDRPVHRGVGVGFQSTDRRHQFVVLVGDGVFRSFVADAVDLTVDCRTLRIVGRLAVNLEELFDLVEQGLLGFVVARAELLGALEHQMFEIVGQTGRFARVVLAADFHGDVGFDARFCLIDAHIDFQSVIQRVDTGLERVVLDRFVRVPG